MHRCVLVCVHECVFACIYMCLCICVFLCVFAWTCAHMYAQGCWHECLFRWMCRMHIFAWLLAHVHILLVLHPLQGACHSLKTHGSLLMIILRLVQNSSELILITLEAATLGHEAVKCECLQMSVQGRQESRRTDQGLVTEKYMPMHSGSRAAHKKNLPWQQINNLLEMIFFWNFPD